MPITHQVLKFTNRISLTAACLTLAATVIGCASSQGFNRGELRQSLVPIQVVDNLEIAAALTKRPQLPKPFRVAIHFREPNDRTQWRWQEADRKLILEVEKLLKVKAEVSAVFPLARELVSGDKIEDLRLAAAHQGADALLIVSGTSSVDRYTGKFGWTYAALVTTLFIPASTAEALFLTQASLWDVRNGFLYMTAEAEEVTSETAPLAWLDEKPLIERSKSAALGRLGVEIERQISGLLASPEQAKVE